MHHRIVRRKLERSSESQDRLGMAPQGLERQSEVVVHCGVVQAEPHGIETATHSEVVPAECSIDFRQGRTENRRLRAQGHRPPDQFGGCLGLSQLMAGNAQKMEGVRMIWLALEAQLVEPGRLGRLAGLVELDRFGEFVA